MKWNGIKNHLKLLFLQILTLIMGKSHESIGNAFHRNILNKYGHRSMACLPPANRFEWNLVISTMKLKISWSDIWINIDKYPLSSMGKPRLYEKRETDLFIKN